MIPCVNNSSPLILSDNDYTLGTGRIRGAQTIDVDLIRGIGQYPYLINADSPNLPTADEYIINNIVFTEAGEMLQYATPVMNNGVYSVRFYEENSNDFTDWQPVFNNVNSEYTTHFDFINNTNVFDTSNYNKLILTINTNDLIDLNAQITNSQLKHGQEIIFRKPFTGLFNIDFNFIDEANIEKSTFIPLNDNKGIVYNFIFNADINKWVYLGQTNI